MAVNTLDVFRSLNRMTVRAEVNPLDKASIVSIFPFDIHEVIHTIQPSSYFIPKGSIEKPTIVVIGGASWWREINEDEPLLEIPVPAITVAKNLVDNWVSGLLDVQFGLQQPGVFAIPGVVTEKVLRENYRDALAAAETKQKEWMLALIKSADKDWARSNGNPLSVNDLSRHAARTLNIEKPWIKDYQAAALVNCVACGSLRNPVYPICPSCRNIVDAELAKKLGIKAAGV